LCEDADGAEFERRIIGFRLEVGVVPVGPELLVAIIGCRRFEQRPEVLCSASAAEESATSG
jgi:hypothetical protein